MDESKYVGLGLMYETMCQAIGSFRSLAQKQAQQLSEQAARIQSLESKLAALAPSDSPPAS